jgi:hypothetical protein
MEYEVSLLLSKEPTVQWSLSCKSNVSMYAMKMFGGVEVYFQGFLSLAVGGCEDPVLYIIFMYVYKQTHTQLFVLKVFVNV